MLTKKEDFKEELENQYTILIKAEERQNKKTRYCRRRRRRRTR